MSNSAFQRHGIQHLSPSSLNLWTASPGLWGLRYLLNFREESNAAMARGKAVEDGMLHILHQKKNPLDAAMTSFDNNLMGEVSETIDDERELIPGMIEQCQLWAPPSPILGAQIKVEHFFDGVSVPVIGYLDFSFDQIDVDLKTTKAKPSAPRRDHVRQAALYRAARNKRGSLLYVTNKKQECFEIDDAARDTALSELHSAAISLERYLSRFQDAEDAVRCLPMNRDDFKWSKAADMKLAELHL